LGVTQDHKEAFKWFRKAAEQNDALAELSLAVCYFRGIGVSQSLDDAFLWAQKSAIQGVADAQLGLGYFYARGQGVETDMYEATNRLVQAV
jgi:TPR repeat protein